MQAYEPPADEVVRLRRELAASSDALKKEIAARERAEQATRDAERESRLIVDNIPGLIAVFTATGEVENVNRQALEYFGKTLEELKAWGSGNAMHPDDLARIVALFEHAIATGTPFEWQSRARRFDGVYRWVETRGHPLRDADGHIVRWYNLIIDVDDRKRAEEALDQARSDLAHVARITSISAMTASIAHEVNQPLSGIITNATTCLLMLDNEPPNVEGARETARRMIRDGHRAAEVIARLRALFGRRESGLEPLELNAAVSEVAALSQGNLTRHGVTLRLELARDLPAVLGDRVQLQQVVLNLIHNATDAMSGVDDRRRELTLRTQLEDVGHIRVSVRDSGVGVLPQMMDRLFETFYTTKRGGMGIGLSVSRSIIERHHGRLWMEANDGPGVTVAFSIPFA